MVGFILGGKIDVVEFALSQLLDGPEQQHDHHVFAHGRGREGQGRHLVEFVIGGVMGVNDKPR